MYILHRPQQRKHSTRSLVILVLAIVGSVIGVLLAKHFLLNPKTTISTPPPPVVTSVTGSTNLPKHITESLFSIDLPRDWEATAPPPNLPYTILAWHNTAQNKGVRVLNVYVDTIPADLAVNRVLAVQTSGNHMTVLGNVSDNCKDFTQPSKQPGNPDKVHGKWQNLDFICDLGNYLRNVVGTASADGTNTLKFTGPTTGQHRYFITYTDHGPTPDYTIFSSVLESFRAK